MTRVLVYEWCVAGGPLAATGNLWSEGWAMLAAAVADFRRVPGVQVATILDARLQTEPPVSAEVGRWPGVAVTWIDDEPTAFRATAADADFALVIAPEFDAILETRCRWAVEAGATLLGPSPDAVALTADKLALDRHFAAHAVPTPGTTPVRPTRHPVVVKPRFGAGSQDSYLVRDSDPIPVAGSLGDMIVQPFVPGRPASVAFLIGPRQTIALVPAWQDISADGRFHYRGGSAPLPPELAERATQVARMAIDAVAGLAGYVGVDVILGDYGDYAIEINPRLTTSYVGLRALTADNFMELLLRLALGESVRMPLWRAGSVSWTASGDVVRSEPGFAQPS